MKNCYFILFIFIVHIGMAQTSIKGNLATTALLIPNLGVETSLGKNLSFQADITASFWKSFDGGPLQLVMVFPELRYYPKATGQGFFVGGHIGGSAYKLQKWNYHNSDRYQEGFSYMMGISIGYQFYLSERWNLEIFAGGGNQQGFYKGYDSTTGERYDGAINFNKSGEWLPYRGGLMLVYKL